MAGTFFRKVRENGGRMPGRFASLILIPFARTRRKRVPARQARRKRVPAQADAWREPREGRDLFPKGPGEWGENAMPFRFTHSHPIRRTRRKRVPAQADAWREPREGRDLFPKGPGEWGENAWPFRFTHSHPIRRTRRKRVPAWQTHLMRFPAGHGAGCTTLSRTKREGAPFFGMVTTTVSAGEPSVTSMAALSGSTAMVHGATRSASNSTTGLR